MVTVLTQNANQRPGNVTFAAVAAGDNLKVVLPTPPSNGVGTYDVTLTGGGIVANANNFFVLTGSGCSMTAGNADSAISVALNGDCLLPTKNGILTSATNAGGVLGFAFAKNVNTPAAAGTVAVGPLAFTAPGNTNVKATNLPMTAGVGTGASLFAIANGQAFPMYNSSGSLGLAAGVDFATATGFADAYQTIIRAQTAQFSISDTALVRREATTAPASAALANFDFSTALPFINNVVASLTVPARPDITITSADPAALATADVGITTISWFATSLDTYATWTIVLPPTSAAFKVPALPADAADFTPVTDSFSVDQAVYFDSSQLPSYGAAKLLPIAPSVGNDLLDTNRPLPAAGTLRVTRFLPNAG
jgi:hypothetical protein